MRRPTIRDVAPSPFTEDFNKLAQQALDRWHVPGASFAVVQGDDIWTKAYGSAQLNPEKEVDPSATLFNVASTTKAHLCAAWALYIDSEANKSKPKDERIGWTTPLAEIIRDDFVLSDPMRTAQVTLEDAVSHRTGLPRHELPYGWGDVDTVKGVVRHLRNLPLHNELRTTFEYCNTPFIAASHALETLTGVPLAQYLRENLWDPLGMTHTYGGYDEAKEAMRQHSDLILATSYTYSKLPTVPDAAEGRLVPDDLFNYPLVSGAGWAISTSADYAKWTHYLLNSSKGGPLSSSIIKELWTPRSIVPSDDHDPVPFDGMLNYGLGWFICTYKGRMVYWHPGGISGAGSLIMLAPELKWGVSFFANGADVSMTLKGLAMELLDRALGVPEGERTGLRKSEEAAWKFYSEAGENYDGARERLYPGAPSSPTMPLALPVEAYAGTYRNKAYGPLTLAVSTSNEGTAQLWCEMSDRVWPSVLEFEHVNAEYWLGTLKQWNSPSKQAVRAESKVGVDGRVEAIGVAVEPAMPETLFWFEKEG